MADEEKGLVVTDDDLDNIKLNAKREREMLAMAYLELWFENPRIKRQEALEKMQEKGIGVKSVFDISRITGSDEWRELVNNTVKQTKGALVATISENIGPILNHQIDIATGKAGIERDAVGAGRNVLDVFMKLVEASENVEIDGKPAVALQINNYYSGGELADSDVEIVEAPVDFDPDEVKSSYIDKTSFGSTSE